MNTPQFKIYGQERRDMRNKLAKLRSLLENFWYYHQLDKDMASFYGSSTDIFPMSDEKAQKIFDDKKLEIEVLERELSLPYST